MPLTVSACFASVLVVALLKLIGEVKPFDASRARHAGAVLEIDAVMTGPLEAETEHLASHRLRGLDVELRSIQSEVCLVGNEECSCTYLRLKSCRMEKESKKPSPMRTNGAQDVLNEAL